MKNIILLSTLLTLWSSFLFSQAVSINTDNSDPDASAILDVKSTVKGMLVPRMTTAQRTAIASPAAGLLVYDTDTKSFWHHQGTGWINILSNSTGWSLMGNVASDSNFIGTTNNQSLLLKANNQQAGKIDLPNKNTLWGYKAGNSTPPVTTTLPMDIGAFIQHHRFRTLQGHPLFQPRYTTLIRDALVFNTTGNYNTANGTRALHSNTTVIQALPTDAGPFVPTPPVQQHCQWIQALFTTPPATRIPPWESLPCRNTTRSNLVAVGDSALYNNGLGASLSYHATGNTALGSKALFANTTGERQHCQRMPGPLFNTTGCRNTCQRYLGPLLQHHRCRQHANLG